MNSRKSKILIGLPAIAGYLSVSEYTIRRYINAGLPCNFILNRWHFHIDNVDKWFQSNTLKQRPADPDKVIEILDE